MHHHSTRGCPPLLAESDLEMELEQDLLFGQEQYPTETVRKVSDVLYMDNVAEKPHQDK